MSEDHFLNKEENIAIHIFSVSAALIGVCLTVIGIFDVTGALKKIAPVGDSITAIDSIFFLLSCIISFAALRTRVRRVRRLLEKIADSIFINGLSLMVLICLLISYKLI